MVKIPTVSLQLINGKAFDEYDPQTGAHHPDRRQQRRDRRRQQPPDRQCRADHRAGHDRAGDSNSRAGFYVTITAKDAFGNPYSGTLALTCSDAKAVLPASSH